jgi:hypothetical protein
MKTITRLLTAVALLLAALPAFAQGEKPNTLTPKEVSDGWILLFDGETQFGWTPRGDARWQVQNGALAALPGSGKGVLSTTTEFADYSLKAEFRTDDKANSGVFLRYPPSGEVTQAGGYEVNIYDKHEKWPTGSINDVARVKGRPNTVGKWNTFEITADGDHLVVRLNGKKAVDARDTRFARGTVGLQYNGEGEVQFRNVKLQPLGLKSLFNGKDLSGWKVVPGHPSVFSVTPEGWLNVKNGNGDLQSEAQYGDFIFQLDVISNGDHLNSGVFFRAEPGQFWSGYESQIRNQWQGDDRTKPVDYGTGGIYNRQPARRVISSDREWFTKTIVAHGKHMAVWINGIQASDYTDDRPPKDNAREGYRAKPGVVSLQGHDPTTDLSFRNLRITELPPARP